MLKEKADLDHAVVPEEYEILDADALAERLGFKRDTVLVYLNRRSFHRIPRPSRRLRTGPLWYEGSVRQWERQNRKKHGKPQHLNSITPE